MTKIFRGTVGRRQSRIGVTIKLERRFRDIHISSDAIVAPIGSVEPSFYQVLGTDLLKLIQVYDKAKGTLRSYAFNKGRTIDVAGFGRIQFDAKARKQIKATVEARWKNKKLSDVSRDEGTWLWEIFK